MPLRPRWPASAPGSPGKAGVPGYSRWLTRMGGGPGVPAFRGTSAVTSPRANRGRRRIPLCCCCASLVSIPRPTRCTGSSTWSTSTAGGTRRAGVLRRRGRAVINGRVVALGAYFGVPVDSIVERLLGEQLDDGGWNCETENGSVRSSFHTTMCVLDGLHAYERRPGALRSRWASARPGVPARAAALPATEHRGGRRRGLVAVLLPDAVALRRAARTGSLLCGWRRGRPTVGRGDLFVARQTSIRRHMAARKHAPWNGSFRDGERRRQSQPVEHAAGYEGARLGTTRVIGSVTLRVEGTSPARFTGSRSTCGAGAGIPGEGYFQSRLGMSHSPHGSASQSGNARCH
jgi:hypothetical protein